MSLPKESWDLLGDMGPYDTQLEALEDIEHFRKDPRKLMLAVIDTQREEKGLDCFAGVYGLIEYNGDEPVSGVWLVASPCGEWQSDGEAHTRTSSLV